MLRENDTKNSDGDGGGDFSSACFRSLSSTFTEPVCHPASVCESLREKKSTNLRFETSHFLFVNWLDCIAHYLYTQICPGSRAQKSI